nr:XRE family transcriptional regulator [Agromyces seonyuensis]
MSEYYGSLASKSAIRDNPESASSSRPVGLPEPTAAEILRRARVASGLTQAEVARHAGVARSMISQYECGDREPSVATLHRLVSATGHSLDWRLTPIRRPPACAEVAAHGWMLRGELAAQGARRPKIVGSVARGEAVTDGAVELLVEVDARFDVDLGRLALLVERAIGHPVRLIDAGALDAAELVALLADAVPL